MTDLQLDKNTDYYEASAPEVAEKDSFAFDDFVGFRTRILNTKLEVLASEIRERFQIRVRNLERIGEDKTCVTDKLFKLDKQALYLMRQHKEKAPFYDELFKLEQERRSQDVECWRDVVLVMRDFLVAWEAHEQAKAKAIFLNHV